MLEKPHLVGHSVLLNDNVVKTFSHLATGPGKSFYCWVPVVGMGVDGDEFDIGEDEG